MYLVWDTPCAWDPRYLQPILDGPLYLEAKWCSGRSVDMDTKNKSTDIKSLLIFRSYACSGALLLITLVHLICKYLFFVESSLPFLKFAL